MHPNPVACRHGHPPAPARTAPRDIVAAPVPAPSGPRRGRVTGGAGPVGGRRRPARQGIAARGLLGLALAGAVTLAVPGALAAAENDAEASLFDGLALRTIGPAVTSGRITDFAVHPERSHHWFVATASGGLWRTPDAGINWTPVFDRYASYSIGSIALDPHDPNVLWVGTGEGNAQRSVAYGDGLYRSVDGGNSFERVGLAQSEHISQIGFHPHEAGVVYVAAQGPLWAPGGDRGFYRTTDGGRSFQRLLYVDEWTGANEFAIHPQRPDHIVVSTWQRHRTQWTMIDGGPGSGLHKTTDGGATWRELTRGLPGRDDLGRIGLARAPSAPDMLYAVVETAGEGGGIYRSTDFGETWEKRSSHGMSAPFYYGRLFVDPVDADRVYAVGTFTTVSEDGGRTFTRLSNDARHVDDHALWIDPEHTGHLLVGGDGGIYESYDGGATWRHVRNLPITQFYRATPDNDTPFYNVYGGTQDNNTLGAPVRTTWARGITNADWLFTLGGDGFKPQIDPRNPDIIYSQYQYGGLARFDRRSGENVYIAPQPDAGEPALRWHWSSPLIISPHDPARLYYGAQMLFRSDDRGNAWRRVSPNLTRQLDRNALEVAGRVWSVDAVAKHMGTSPWGSITALDESPLVEGLLFAGTDDGLIQVSEDGGKTWRRTESIVGVPSLVLVEDLVASHHDEAVVFGVFDNHKAGDFRPYVFRSDDRGATWTDISGNLPERGSAHTIVQDHVNPELLFVGTEFGLYVTQDGGGHWVALKGNFPTIAVRDLEIQRRESDLVVATFGRGIYVLDDLSPLRTPAAQITASEAMLFPVKDALAYFPRETGADPGKAFYAADNPPFGAVFTYYLHKALKTLREQRRETERELAAAGKDTPYPSWDALRREDREEAPSIVLRVEDADGGVVRRIEGPTAAGFHRVAWDLRYPALDPIELGGGAERPYWQSEPRGPMVAPGEYRVSLAARVQGELQPLGEAQSFRVSLLEQGGLAAPDRAAVLAFEQRTARLERAVKGAREFLEGMNERVAHLKAALLKTPQADESLHVTLREIEAELMDIAVVMLGDRTVERRQEPAPWSIVDRVASITRGHWESMAPVTQTHRRAYEIAAEEFSEVLARLAQASGRLERFESRAEALRAPWTPGRLPTWRPERAGDRRE